MRGRRHYCSVEILTPFNEYRKIVGLPNSSNVVEQENQMIVSIRQKDDLMAWRTIGSSSVASISAMYRNNEQDT